MEPRRLLDGKIAWFGTPQNPIDVPGGEVCVFVSRWSVGDQTACRKNTGVAHDRQRQTVCLREVCDRVTLRLDQRFRRKQYRFRVCAADGHERGLEFAGTRHFDHLCLHPQSHGALQHVFDELRNSFVGRIDEQGDAPQARSRLLEKLQQLAGEFVAEVARARDIATWLYEARNNSKLDGVRHSGHHDGYRLRPLHESASGRHARDSTDCGIASASALAALRLMINSNFVGCSIGRSAGFAPLRILSTYTAARPTKSAMFTA